MQLKHIESITSPTPGIMKVTAICWSPNGKKLAICTTDRVVVMFDENGVKRDKFSTKPADKVSIFVILGNQRERANAYRFFFAHIFQISSLV